MVEKTSATIEDYLGVMFIMQRDGEPVVGARLAELLGVTPPTVTNTLKRMVRDGLVVMKSQPGETQEGPHLTEHGLAMAKSVMRRHMLTEWMLVRMLNVSWSHTHSEAHHIEHSISAAIEEQMRTSLDAPKLCPHGNPLPGYEYMTAGWKPLSDMAAGQQVIIRRIHETAEDVPDLLNFLETNGIIPGKAVEVAEVLPFNQTLTLLVDSQRVTLGFTTAHYIYVEDQP